MARTNSFSYLKNFGSVRCLLQDCLLRPPELLKVGKKFEVTLKKLDDAADVAVVDSNEVADGNDADGHNFFVEHLASHILDGVSDPTELGLPKQVRQRLGTSCSVVVVVAVESLESYARFDLRLASGVGDRLRLRRGFFN